MLSPLGLSPSFGFGDRLGLATPGHLAAAAGCGYAPVFAQQSVRENARTGRTPRQVLDDARRAVDAAGWDAPWGADADHLKSPADLPPFVDAGYTFFTVDPGDSVDNAADTDPLPVLRSKIRAPEWGRLSALYRTGEPDRGWGGFDEETLLRAAVKYGAAIRLTNEMYRQLTRMRESFDFEMSVDETDSPTSPLEHFFIASELTRLGIKFTSLAPRLPGRFEKGVDYIGDLAALDAVLGRHAAVTAHFGTYKLSLHSGSDKFSVYPLLVAHWGSRLHVKTAGTSYLEALRVVARRDPHLFERIYALARQHYASDRRTYHVSAALDALPVGMDPPALLDDFHAREVLHVTFGTVLARHGAELKSVLQRHAADYREALRGHFGRHLQALNQEPP